MPSTNSKRGSSGVGVGECLRIGEQVFDGLVQFAAHLQRHELRVVVVGPVLQVGEEVVVGLFVAFEDGLFTGAQDQRFGVVGRGAQHVVGCGDRVGGAEAPGGELEQQVAAGLVLRVDLAGAHQPAARLGQVEVAGLGVAEDGVGGGEEGVGVLAVFLEVALE